MYQSRYKHKHAERRARLKKITYEGKTAPIPEASSAAIQQAASFANQFGLQNQLDQQRRQQLSQFAQPQQMAPHNQFGGIASLLGGASLFGR